MQRPVSELDQRLSANQEFYFLIISGGYDWIVINKNIIKTLIKTFLIISDLYCSADTVLKSQSVANVFNSFKN